MQGKTLYSVRLVLLGAFILSSLEVSAQPQSERAKQLMALVDKAAALIESKGKEAFPEFRKKDSEWYRDSTYIFVIDMKGTMLMHPVKPELEGKNQMDLKDTNGKAFVKEMVDILKVRNSDWVEYMWPKPGETQSSRKLSYIRKAKLEGEEVIVGSGLYP